MALDEIVRVLPSKLRMIVGKLDINYEKLQEVRLRVGLPLLFVYDNQEFFIDENRLLKKVGGQTYRVTSEDLKESMEYISDYSMYAFEEELRQGFITIQGGHRVGIAGKAVMQGGKVLNIRHVSFINIRLSHQVKGCANTVMKYITNENSIYNTLIISPPKCGKTTLLRDMIRQISDGDEKRKGKNVGVVDERSELGACYLGIPQNDLGMRTDVLDCCPKAEGMMMLIRSMSPEVIAVDEIGTKNDIEAMEYAINCGCVLIATVHGQTMEDVRQKPILGQLVKSRIFKRYILLTSEGGVGNVADIFDERGKQLFERE